MKFLKYATITLFALASMKSYAQDQDSAPFRLYNSRIIIEGDSSVFDAIGCRCIIFNNTPIPQDGKFILKTHAGYTFSQYLFYDGYLFDSKCWYKGKLVDHTICKKVIKHFKII